MRTITIILFCMLTAVTSIGRASEFSGSIRAEIKKLANEIVNTIEAVEQPSVDVGQIIPIGSSSANGGPGLRLELISALEEKRKGVVSKDAVVALQIEYELTDDPSKSEAKRPASERLLVEKLDWLLKKKGGDPIKNSTLLIRRLADIAVIEGVNAHIPSDEDLRPQHKELRKQIREPQSALESDGKIRSHAGSPYALQVWKKKVDAGPSVDTEISKTSLVEGNPNISIDKGELYVLRFINESDEEVGVSIKIDGIDVFAFSEDRDAAGHPKYTHYIVAPHGTLDLPGWHKTNDPKRDDNFVSFLVTDYGKGAASKFPQQATGQIGVITVAVARTSEVGHGRSGAETGFGPPVKGDLKEVRRDVDQPHEFISVRYLR